MGRIKIISIISLASGIILSCSNSNGRADGYGNFEATELTVSAEATGKIMSLTIEEGQSIKKQALIGYIDTIPLSLKREQLTVSKSVIASKSKGVLSQINVLNAQLKTANTNKIRVENLIKDKAGTQKQLDDVNGEIDIINQQIRSVEAQNAPVISELKSIDVQIEQIEDQIQKSKIINPIDGTILVKYAEPNEVTAFGRPLYKISDLRNMELRVYLSETSLATIKIGQEVTVKIDAADSMRSFKGTINWIASEAEFTPKIIQTKEERVALVYAVKINVSNDGSIKIGMPAEMWLNQGTE